MSETPRMSEVSEQSTENFSYMAKMHRCKQCHNFFRGCRCNRKMYRRYKKSCTCKSILSLLLCGVSVFILYKVAMYVYNSPMLQNAMKK